MEPTEVYLKLLELQEQKTAIEQEIKNYKNELDSLMVAERDPEIKTIFIPNYINEEDIVSYLDNKFPAYEIVKIKVDGSFATIKEKEEFVPKKMEFPGGGKVYRRISKGRPSIDLDQLQTANAEIFSEIVTLVPEIDEDKLNQLIERDSSIIDVIEESIKMESPSVAIVVSKGKGDTE
jgi:hypothetical protein